MCLDFKNNSMRHGYIPVYAAQERRQFSDSILAADQTPYCINFFLTKPVEDVEAFELWDKPCISREILNCKAVSAGSDFEVNED